MRTISLGITVKDKAYAEAFARTVALDHKGIGIVLNGGCDACKHEVDVCLVDEKGTEESAGNCEAKLILREKIGILMSNEEPLQNCVYKYAGVAAILAKARQFVFERKIAEKAGADSSADISIEQETALVDMAECFVPIYSRAGGVGASCTAIGLGRELSRYRGKKTLYMSLEEAESTVLFPQSSVQAKSSEEILYRYLRLKKSGVASSMLYEFLRTAFFCDEYGLYRARPDREAGSFAALSLGQLAALLLNLKKALELDHIVLDFGTRLRFLREFIDITEARAIRVVREGDAAAIGDRDKRGDNNLLFVNPACHEDIRHLNGYIDVGIANAFGLAIKELCDIITCESAPEENAVAPGREGKNAKAA